MKMQKINGIKSITTTVVLVIINVCLTITNSVINCDINNNFISVPTTVKTFRNDTVLLPCYHKSGFRSVRWLHDENLLIDSSNQASSIAVKPPERVTLFGNGSLQVANLISGDTGEYICEVMTLDGLATQIHAIEVQHPPSIKSEPNGRIEKLVGEFFEIICEATGIPQPIITWRHNGRSRTDQLDNTRRLLVDIRDRSMAGAIDCVATNGVGEATAGVNLVVLFSPEITVSSSIVHSKISLRAYLECEVIAEPSATVHWFHHNVPVIPDNRIIRQDYEVLQSADNINNISEPYSFGGSVGAASSSSSSSSLPTQYTYSHTKHVLVIKKVRDSDLGLYECRAENKIGFKGAILELTGRPKPSTFKTSPLASSPMTHNLIWQTESLSPIIEYILKFRQIPSGNITPQNRYGKIDWMELIIPSEISEGPIHTIGYTLRGLMPASVYEVAVTSRNRYGWSDISRIIRFATGGEIELPNYSTETIDYEPIEDNYLPSDINTNPSSVFNEYSSSGGIMLHAFSSLCIICILYRIFYII